MKANTIQYRDYWTQEVANRLYGFNVNPRTNRIDEYERYNQIRRDQYARQDAEYRKYQRMIQISLVALLCVLADVLK